MQGLIKNILKKDALCHAMLVRKKNKAKKSLSNATLLFTLITFFCSKEFYKWYINYIKSRSFRIDFRIDTIFQCYFSFLWMTKHTALFYLSSFFFTEFILNFTSHNFWIFKIESLKGICEFDFASKHLNNKTNVISLLFYKQKPIFVYSIKTACSAVCNSCCKNNRKHCTSNMSTTIHVCRNWSTIV